MLFDEVLVCELRSVDRFASLAHESGDYAVELRAFVVERLAAPAGSFLAGAECSEVLRRAWCGVGEELHEYSSGRLTADGHVEEDLGIRHSEFLLWIEKV